MTHQCNVAQEDVSFSAGRYPSAHEFRRLVEILDRARIPFCCIAGRGRTAPAWLSARDVAADDLSLQEARRQMSLRYGHVALGRPANLDRYLDLYSSWLELHGRVHSREAVRSWIAGATFPGDGLGRLEVLEIPEPLPSGRPWAAKVRAHNLGTKPWRFRKGANVGNHVCFWLYDAEERCVRIDHTGLFDAEVQPKEFIDVTLALPSLTPGKYRLIVDLIDEPHCFFFQVGSEPLERELVVTP